MASAISLGSEVMIPVIEKWCKEINMPPRLFLMPMSYIMPLSSAMLTFLATSRRPPRLVIGTFAIFSTSSNLVAQSLLMERGLEPFGNFEISPLAFTCGAVTLLYLAIAVPLLLYIESSVATPTQSPKAAAVELLNSPCRDRCPLRPNSFWPRSRSAALY